MMAERRMFAKSVIGADAFLDLPAGARLLYYDLAMRADDDGFVNAPKTIMRMVGAAPADLEALIKARFLLAFENGVVAIRHWKAHNYIQNDRYHPTVYQNEKSMLITEGNSYELRAQTACIHSVSILDTEVRIESEQEQEQEIEIEPEQEREIEPETETEKESPRPTSPSSSGFSLPTKEKKKYVVGDEKIKVYAALWPELDMNTEFSAMQSWLQANPERQKTLAQTPRFVYGWLSRAHDKARASPAERQQAPCSPEQREPQRRENRYADGSYAPPPSYDMEKAMEEMMTGRPKVQKRRKR